MNSKVVVVWVRGGQGVKLLSAAVKNPEVFQLPTGHNHSGFFGHQSNLFLLASE